MRRRLTAAMVGLVVMTMALYVIPRTFFTADFARSREIERLERSALLIGRGIEILVESGAVYGPDSFPTLLQPGEQITVEHPGTAPVIIGSVDGESSTHSVTAELDTLTVTLTASAADIDEEVSAALRPVPYLVAMAGGVGILMAILLATRLVRPFAALADYTERLDPDADSLESAPRSNLPEADSLGQVLESRVDQIRTLVRRERRFSANASHQLRTPLAALRRRVEDLRNWPEVTEEVRGELDAVIAEADRLAATIQDLLTLARSGGLGAWDDVDVASVVTSAADRWADHLAAHGRRIDVELPAPIVVASSARSVGEILNVVLENAYSHGREPFGSRSSRTTNTCRSWCPTEACSHPTRRRGRALSVRPQGKGSASGSPTSSPRRSGHDSSSPNGTRRRSSCGCRGVTRSRDLGSAHDAGRAGSLTRCRVCSATE